MATDVLVGLAIMAGASFMLVAAIGMWRMTDFFQRIHAPTKAATLGLLLMLGANAILLPSFDTSLKAILAVMFFALTAPVGAHLLSRTAYRRGIRPGLETKRDDYQKVAEPSRKL